MVKTELYTSGGEFKRPDGSDYVGAYHVHVNQGAMVGGFHKTSAHDRLTPSTRISRSLVERIMQQLKSEQTPTPPRRNPTPPRRTQTRSSGSSGSSSGGGY